MKNVNFLWKNEFAFFFLSKHTHEQTNISGRLFAQVHEECMKQIKV